MEAIDDYSGGSAHYNASLDNMMTIATGFVIEALEKKSIKQASSILTQMVNCVVILVLIGLMLGRTSSCQCVLVIKPVAVIPCGMQSFLTRTC